MQFEIIFFMLVFTYLYHTVNVNCSLIDSQHLKEFPYCGTVSKGENVNHDITSRVVNSKIPINEYRWVVFIAHRTIRISGDWKKTQCSGSVITDR